MAAGKKAKTTKKSVKKVTTSQAKTSVKVKNELPMNESVMSSPIDTSTVKKMSTKRKASILAALIIIGVVLYLSKGLLLAASVNGELIYRPTIISELEKRFGKQEIESLITEKLINQEASKKGVTLSEDELNAEITKISDNIKAQGQDLDTLLTMQGMSKDDLRKQIKTQKLVEKILADKVKPTDQEVADYIKANKDSLPKDKKPEEINDLVKTQLSQQKLNTEFQTWLEEVKKNASIKYYTSY